MGIADGANGLIYLGRGQWGNAGISALGIVPYLGDIGKGGRLGVKGLKHIPPSGYKSAKDFPFNSHGQKVYKKGSKYITPDVDSHKGGIWKMFDKKGNRMGTFDDTLKNRIGD